MYRRTSHLQSVLNVRLGPSNGTHNAILRCATRHLRIPGILDTGHFFNTSLIQGLVFEGIVKGQESKVWVFFKGLRSRIEKMTKTPSFLGQKLK